jgi:hypothetical protein
MLRILLRLSNYQLLKKDSVPRTWLNWLIADGNSDHATCNPLVSYIRMKSQCLEEEVEEEEEGGGGELKKTQ